MTTELFAHDSPFARYRAASQRQNAPLQVSALNAMVRQQLEKTPGKIQVIGELAALTKAASGHWYFALKDGRARVRCTLWRERARSVLRFRLDEGMQVIVDARVTLYEAGGDYQLNVENIQPAGQGQLYEAFLRIRAQLNAEGLFAAARKRPIPRYPAAVALVTSPAAAALHDVQACLQRRAPHLAVHFFAAAVQGAQAAEELTAAMGKVAIYARQQNIALVLLVRGGGSAEDLSAFNDPVLARTIYACPVPVITGIGHETDYTIADLVADVRATTPSAAAEYASAGYYEARQALPAFSQRLDKSLQTRLQAASQRLDRLQIRLLHPRQQIERNQKSLQQSTQRLAAAWQLMRERKQTRLTLLQLRLRACLPSTAAWQKTLNAHKSRLEHACQTQLKMRQQQLQNLQTRLLPLHPEAALARGYSIVRDAEGRLVQDATTLVVGDEFSVRMAHGSIKGRVIKAPAARGR